MNRVQICWRENVQALASAAPFYPADLSLFKVEGADAQDFLQAQLSCDLRQLGADHVRAGAWCDASGRVLTTLHVLRHGGAFLLLLPASLAHRLLPRLRMFVLRTKVVISSVGGAGAVLGLGAAAVAALQSDIPTQSGSVADCAGGRLLRLPGPRWLLCDPQPTRLLELLGELPDIAALTPPGWQLLSLLGEVPWICPATSGSFTAHALSLDVFDAISRSKGCYPGQEVIARTHYRGASKRALHILSGSLAHLPDPGSSIQAAGLTETWGHVVDAAHSLDGRVWLSAVARVDVAPEQLILDDTQLEPAGTAAQVQRELPITNH